ncbi:pirin family protein [Flavobacterium sp. MXW15]|uniref:Pirin family protein n=1 Tax=Xanthomonas chitinilytica TaxID=2989819 RepID=A0ABT3JS35_9XANT|nr:pirin family protein [Xanthomonas sp. H13-6]MCW4454074.1 pirin family protein [Flavobacterium sp. MXW15]MCW4471308.1 pirin family protein [Xanthomonas sp. H13-6]
MTRSDTATHPTGRSGRRIAHRTRGRGARFISPDELGHVLKPFVYFDLFDKDGPEMMFGLHPHSGIATVTGVFEGAVAYTDPSGTQGTVLPGGFEWMMAGKGMWHGGGAVEGRVAGFQLWLALPPGLELANFASRYIGSNEIDEDGPARVLLGCSGSATGKVASDLPVTLLTVRLAAGETWRFTPPEGQDLLWIALAEGALSVPDDVVAGELIVFERSDGGVVFEAKSDAHFVLGASKPHDHELAIGRHSVHTSPGALAQGERYIRKLGAELRKLGRI